MSRVRRPNLTEPSSAMTLPQKDKPPAELKAAEFAPVVRETILTLGGGYYSFAYGSMYRAQPAVRAVVDFLARNIAQLNPKVYARLSGTERVEMYEHPLAVLLRNPNPSSTQYTHLRDTVADLAIYDRAYWLKMRNGRTLSVVRLSPAGVTKEVNEATGATVYRYADGQVIPRGRLVVFAGYNPDGHADGVSPLETLRRVLEEEMAAQQNRQSMWRNSARQSGFVQRPLEAPDWSDVARQRFRADMEATLTGGANGGRIGVLEEGMTWNAAAFSPKDTEYIAGRRLTYEEVSTVYFGPIAGRAWLEASTGSGSEEQHRQMYQDVLGPWLGFLEGELELQLLPEVEPLRQPTYVEFNLAEKLKGSFEEQGKTLVTAVGVPYMTPNEARARLNMPRIDDPSFDLPVQPLNVLYGGQPAVTVPTADPSTPDGVLSMGAPRTKALKAAPAAALRRRDEAVASHEALLRRFFERQERSVLSAKAMGDVERWNRELAGELYSEATVLARQTGELAAAQLDGTYDEQRTLAYLAEATRRTAESVNAHTDELIENAEDSDAVRNVFAVAKGSRAAQIALGQATSTINFARTEAAIHSRDADGRERSKTWIVTSGRSRHPEMNGETVAVSEDFSNGMAWPGDAAGGSAETAGCHCLLQLG